MAALITLPIPEQGFEKVRDAIGAILKLELDNQKTLQDFPEEIQVYCERVIPMTEEENLYFNVLLDGATYGNITEKDTQGRTVFYVDVYTTGISGSTASGSLNTSLRLHKFLGLVRFILSSTKYKTLGFPLGLIGGTYVEGFSTPDPDRSGDSSFTSFGRLTLAVRINESQDAWAGIDLIGTETVVKLSETEKGYRYEFGPE